MEQQHQDLIRRGASVMSELESEGYDAVDIPADILECEVDGLESQLLASRGQWDEVDDRLKEGFRRHSAPAWIQATYGDYQRTPASSEHEKLAYCTTCLRYLVDSERKKLGLEPRNRKGDTK